jgi:hypothetical protein
MDKRTATLHHRGPRPFRCGGDVHPLHSIRHSHRDAREQLDVRGLFEVATVSSLATFIWPLLVMSRRRRKQDRILDCIRAAYVLACENLMTGQRRAAEKRLRAIRQMERRWHFGASTPYRVALTAYAAITNFAIAVTAQFLQQHSNLQIDRKTATLDDTIDMFLDSPWPWIFLIAQALLFGLIPVLDALHIKGRPWAEFYGDRLAQALKAGKGIDVAPQHESGQVSGVTTRELLGFCQD